MRTNAICFNKSAPDVSFVCLCIDLLLCNVKQCVLVADSWSKLCSVVLVLKFSFSLCFGFLPKLLLDFDIPKVYFSFSIDIV